MRDPGDAQGPMSELGVAIPSRARFRQIYDAEIGFVCNFLRRLGVLASDVEDVAQEVFASVHAKLDAYDASRPLRPWIAGFAVHCAAGYRRKARNRDVPTETLEQQATVGSGIAKREAHETVMHGLGTLDDGQREVLVLHDLYGHSMEETAGILAIPVNTGYSRLRVARERFRAAIQLLQREAG
jgi:RNA polymerase sigma-70 factor (ECF subfamily)